MNLTSKTASICSLYRIAQGLFGRAIPNIVTSHDIAEQSLIANSQMLRSAELDTRVLPSQLPKTCNIDIKLAINGKPKGCLANKKVR